MIDKLPPLEDLIKEFKDTDIETSKMKDLNFDKTLSSYLNTPKQNSVNPIRSYFDLKTVQESKTPEEVAESLQTIFFEIMLKEMKKSMFEFSSSDFENRMYMDMFFMQLAQVMADSNQLGLKDYILKAINSYIQNSKTEG